MTQHAEPARAVEPPATLPRGLAAILRPELASVGEEIIAEIRRTIPEYARPLDGPYGHALRMGVEQAMCSFVDQVADPSVSRQRRDDVCRKLGQSEANEGRSLDSLQAAYRVGVRVAWQRIMRIGRRRNLSSPVMSLLADGLFAYMDELASLSYDGYVEAKTRSAGALEESRNRLLYLILDTPPAAPSAVAELASLACWPVPAEVTPVALHAGTKCVRPLLDGDVLVDLFAAEPRLLVPGPVTRARRSSLAAALPIGPVAIGSAVPIADAANSLRWARQALTLADTGMFGPGRLISCDEHLPALWLASDDALIEQLARRQFAPLAGLTPKQRNRLIETLGAWLDCRGGAPEIAERLHIHPQTVRYRMRQLEKTFGDKLDDPEARFAMELVLRARRLRERQSGDAAIPPSAGRRAS